MKTFDIFFSIIHRCSEQNYQRCDGDAQANTTGSSKVSTHVSTHRTRKNTAKVRSTIYIHPSFSLQTRWQWQYLSIKGGVKPQILWLPQNQAMCGQPNMSKNSKMFQQRQIILASSFSYSPPLHQNLQIFDF